MPSSFLVSARQEAKYDQRDDEHHQGKPDAGVLCQPAEGKPDEPPDDAERQEQHAEVQAQQAVQQRAGVEERPGQTAGFLRVIRSTYQTVYEACALVLPAFVAS